MTDGEGNIAMMKIENSDYYKLPGGSIEITETPDKAFLREVSEETGYPAELIGYLGWIEEHKFRSEEQILHGISLLCGKESLG